MTASKKLMSAVGDAGEPIYVDSLFSTYLYTGNGSTQNINNGINLADEGGMVWIKSRSNVTDNRVVDSETNSNFTRFLETNKTNSLGTESTTDNVKAFQSYGFTLGTNFGTETNEPSYDYASWTFRKSPGFFDVVTYTGNGSTQTISHNLGCVPAMIVIKATNASTDWIVYHKSLGSGMYLTLNSSSASGTSSNFMTSVSSTSFSFGGADTLFNGLFGETYVAYLFADGDDAAAQIFGDNGDQAVVKCGSYTGNGSSSGPEIDLGFEPQWLLIKRSDGTSDGWVMVDIMRGLAVDGNGNYLYANASNAESSADVVNLTATGFQISNAWGAINIYGGTYIYIAIRRPHKPAESGSEVFDARYSTNTDHEFFDTGFDADLLFSRDTVTAAQNNFWGARLTGQAQTSQHLLYSNSTAAEVATSGRGYFGAKSGGYYYGDARTSLSYAFKRSPGFFDVVCYEGDKTTSQQIAHNLGVTPELIIVKDRDRGESWSVYADPLGNTKELRLNVESKADTESIASVVGGTWGTHTDSYFEVGTNGRVGDTSSYIAYLFASQDGISKVGSYTGNGSSKTIDCGFSSGARFVLIKRTDSTSNWNLFDTERGIVAGNDPRLVLNYSIAEDTGDDAIDPDSSGFIVNYVATNDDDVNVSGGTYIYLAIA